MKKILPLAAATAALVLALTMLPKYTKYTGAIFNTFDTAISVVSYQKSQEQFDELMEITTSKFEELNKLFDIYNSYEGINNVKTINDNAGKAPVKVDPQIIELIEFSKEWYERADGKTNIAMGSVLKLWHDTRSSASAGQTVLPSAQELEEANKHTDISKVIIDKENSTVFLSDSEMSLDVGAVAKGFATEIVCDILNEKYDNYAISAGGNVKTHGRPKDTRTRWGIGIQNPKIDENFNMVGGNVDLAYVNGDKSLVCSGGYERFFVYEGRRYHHLIDPITLFPEEYYQGVTILCEDSGVADALSTAIFLMKKEEALALIESIDGAECILVMKDGEIIKSTGMDRVLKSNGITSTTP